MGTVLTIMVLASALITLLTGVSALRAGLKLHRTRIALQTHLISDVTRLAGRATELERSLAGLDARAQALPVRISELQQNLATLRILTHALGTSLRQAQRVLQGGIKSSLTRPHAGASETGATRDNRQPDHGGGEIPRP
jgi:hypothetical protein